MDDDIPVMSRIWEHFEQVFLEQIEPVGSDSNKTKIRLKQFWQKVVVFTLELRKVWVDTENVVEEDLLQSFLLIYLD